MPLAPTENEYEQAAKAMNLIAAKLATVNKTIHNLAALPGYQNDQQLDHLVALCAEMAGIVIEFSNKNIAEVVRSLNKDNN